MTKNTRFSPEVRQRAVRMVLESQGEYDSQWAAICSIAPKIGCTPETLRVWVRQHERDTGGGDGGLTTAERQRLKELERENRERFWKVRANMTHNGRQFVPLPQRLAVHQRLCVCGFVSMSGIPGAVMVDSPPLNVSV